jgi:adenylate kinase
MILLMGVAGSGKSIQGRLFADEQGFAWISTGELLRVLITGRQRQEMLQGKLLNDEVMINILDKIFELVDLKKEFVLDGFPRTVPQAEWLLRQTKQGRLSIDAVFNLTVSQEVSRRRLQARGRLDDIDEVIDKRFKEYDEVTQPIITLFRGQGLNVYEIDASQDPRTVRDAIWKRAKSLNMASDDNKS